MPGIAPSRTRDWESRLKRARELSERYPAAAEILTVYRRIAEFQKQVFEQEAPESTTQSQPLGSLRSMIDFERVMQHLPSLLAVVEQAGTPILKEVASTLREWPHEESLNLFEKFVRGESVEGPESFFVRVCVQPYAERLAASVEVKPGFAGSVCPLCEGRPQLAVLRPEGDGGKRFLQCSFCVTEWEFRRVLCPICGELDYQKLPRYTSDDVPWVRVDACDTCHYYLKSFDMTVDGRAVPLVDEIATVSLDLWATEREYKKTHQNLMGF